MTPDTGGRTTPDQSTPERTGIKLYHGTNAEFANGDIETGQGMFGIHLTTDENAAKDYRKNVKPYTLSKDAKMLDLSDGETLWEFMKKEGIVDAEDAQNPDLENYVKGGQVFQYDLSSRTSCADEVARTVQGKGFDVVKMPDDLGGKGDNIAYVVVNKGKLKPFDQSSPAKFGGAAPDGEPDSGVRFSRA